MHKSRPYACNVSNPTQPLFKPILLASLASSYTVLTLTSLSSPSNNITDLSSKKEEGEVKTALEICKADLPNTATKLSEAKKSLVSGDYDKVNQSIEFALSFPLGCLLQLNNVNFTFPQLSSQIQIYAQLSDAAMRIIDRF
ncbi:hypothetical protein CARUB_v10003862mg [Capsella rubella]|uniref:Pectinesterase inhibitor domain-containing protein n=1 Tax=Capsella rubella TaxID=81985 RepID=R0FM62_9BRAS|nr:uncharacterized protein LOC17883307 isoform X2 [Capsella rubella]EOA23081.1 hypothetical protein CARUB_v10003862mg [Capsella rubella]